MQSQLRPIAFAAMRRVLLVALAVAMILVLLPAAIAAEAGG